ENIAVVVLINARDNDSAYPLANEILKVMLPKWQMPVRPAQTVLPFKPDATLKGSWKGNLHTYEGSVPATIKIMPAGETHVQIGDKLPSLLHEAQLQDGILSGKAWGDFGTGDIRRNYGYSLSFELRLR